MKHIPPFVFKDRRVIWLGYERIFKKNKWGHVFDNTVYGLKIFFIDSQLWTPSAYTAIMLQYKYDSWHTATSVTWRRTLEPAAVIVLVKPKLIRHLNGPLAIYYFNVLLKMLSGFAVFLLMISLKKINQEWKRYTESILIKLAKYFLKVF